MRIVVLDGKTLNPGDLDWGEIASLGSFEVFDRSAPEDVVPRARGAEVVLTNKTRLDAATIEALPELRFIAVLATGYDVVDVAAARARGIVVSNVPEYGTDSVAQHTMALVLELASAVGEHDRAVQEGEWSRSPDFCFWRTAPTELAGKAFGLIGFGRIGRRVGALAHAFGMRVLVADRSAGPAGGTPDRRAAPRAPEAYPFTVLPLEEMLPLADVVSLHCPLHAENARFANAAFFARMKRSAFFVNTARGGLVDEPALAAALRSGTIAGAALDVVSKEPIPEGHPLLGVPRCILTPHIAWATREARRRLMSTTAENVRAYLRGAPIHVVAP